ncbi:MAG TPA: asparaginase [Longimicrobiales bacterium]|nr:asparaginase [Longimicrobiales bacterium]
MEASGFVGEACVEVLRGGVVESSHRVHVAVVDGAGRLRARAGEVDFPTFARSAIKPLQALPLVEDGAAADLELSARELALCCASHSGEPHHAETAAAILAKAEAGVGALACGAHEPYHGPSARALRERGEAPTRLHNNCSGKHAGMLALARFHGWPQAGYHRADHPVQQRMLQEVERWSGLPAESIATAVDGCGVLTFGLPLQRLAGAMARFAAAARRPEGGAGTLVRAMADHPEYVGGSERLCTELMRAVGGRLFAKVGAEGVYCAASPGAELGIALKVEDGARRAAEPALVAVLGALGLLSEQEQERLERWGRPALRNTRGEVVGRLRPRVALTGTGLA